MFVRTIVVLLLLVAAPVFAQEEEVESPWSGKATLGYLATSGNTENSTLNTGAELGYTTGAWAHVLRGLAINSTEDDATTAEAYELAFKSERSLSESNYLFGRLHWRSDRFSSYDSQFAQAVGYGRRLIDRAPHLLKGEIGVGARQSDLVDGSSENEVIATGGLDYTYTISETSEFTQLVGVEAGDTNTYILSITALRANLINSLALVASYTVKHNTDVLPGTDKTDTYTALSLEYAF